MTRLEAFEHWAHDHGAEVARYRERDALRGLRALARSRPSDVAPRRRRGWRHPGALRVYGATSSDWNASRWVAPAGEDAPF